MWGSKQHWILVSHLVGVGNIPPRVLNMWVMFVVAFLWGFSLWVLWISFFPPGKPTVQNIHSTRPEDLQVPEHQWKLLWLPLLINIIVLFNCWQEVAMTKKLNNLCLRMVPTNYKGFCTRLWPGRKSRSLQGPLESTKKIRSGQAVFLRLGLNLN